MTARTLDELGDRLFASVPEASAILGRDPRVIRKAAELGDIPSRRVGRKWLIPTQWIRAEAGMSGMSASFASAEVDFEKLADLVNRRAAAQLAAVFSRLATEFGTESEAT